MTAQVPEGSVIITPAEVYAKVVALTEVVTELVTSDKAEERERIRLENAIAEQGKRIDRQDAEIGALKQKLWFVAGLASAGGAGLGSIVAPLLVR